MKREAVHHSKMKRLCRKLNLELWQAVGLLESIWLLTARQTPRGDIGKLSDEDIAIAIDYQGDEHQMIGALVESGWIDRNDQYRLIIHDWPDHAEDGVHMKVARAREFFICQGADGKTLLEAPKLSRFFAREREPLREFYEEHKTSPKNAIRAHAVRTERQSVRTERQSVRTKSQSVAKTPPRPRPLTQETSKTLKANKASSSGANASHESIREVATALALDDDAAQKLISETRKIEPTITETEIVALANMKRSQIRGKVENLVGLLITSVPKMASGAPLAQVRNGKNGNAHSADAHERSNRQIRSDAERTISDPRAGDFDKKLAREVLANLK